LCFVGFAGIFDLFEEVNEMKKYFVATLICLVLMASVAHGAIIHVPGDQPTIQAGIDAAVDGDTVLVADGTWTSEGNKDLDFKGKAITVTSENGAENCIIDCEGSGRGFYFHSEEDADSVVDSFTITNGYADYGGGVYCYNSSPMITNNIITNNSSDYHGGGIACFTSSPTITNNILSGNSTPDRGGAIYCVDYSAPTIMNNTLSMNSADVGGGIDCRTYSNATITNNILNGNFASSSCGGISCLDSNPKITNNILTKNLASLYVGGIGCTNNSSPTIINNTISENLAGINGGGIGCSEGSFPTVLNTILWKNSPDEIYVDGTSEIDITYSDIQGGWTGEGNIDADPMFVDANNNDYHLNDYSPCIGAGIQVSSMPDTDIGGNPRPNPPGSNPDIGAYENPLAEPLPINGSINGTVTDMAGNPIKWALVIAVLGETKIKAFTNREGNYEILNLEPGAYWVLCIKKGYKVGIRKAEVVAGGVTTVDFRLRENPE
jgi:hypothetical protein